MDFEELLSLYQRNIMRVCAMFSKHQEEQKDLFQEICIQLFKSLPLFQTKSTLTTFIYRIAINTCIRFKYKHQLGIKKIGLEDVEWYVEDETAKKMDKNERLEQLHSCIGRLNDVDKSIVLLYLEDMTPRQIAEIAGITENHVAVKMNRIRERLFKCLTLKSI